MKNIWEGIYNNFEECPKAGRGFEGDTWISSSLDKIKMLVNTVKENNTIPTSPSYHVSLLPFLAAFMHRELGEVKILDFGGCLGFSYIQVINAISNNTNTPYLIVEKEKICEVGKMN